MRNSAWLNGFPFFVGQGNIPIPTGYRSYRRACCDKGLVLQLFLLVLFHVGVCCELRLVYLVGSNLSESFTRSILQSIIKFLVQRSNFISINFCSRSRIFSAGGNQIFFTGGISKSLKTIGIISISNFFRVGVLRKKSICIICLGHFCRDYFAFFGFTVLIHINVGFPNTNSFAGLGVCITSSNSSRSRLVLFRNSFLTLRSRNNGRCPSPILPFFF